MRPYYRERQLLPHFTILRSMQPRSRQRSKRRSVGLQIEIAASKRVVDRDSGSGPRSVPRKGNYRPTAEIRNPDKL